MKKRQNNSARASALQITISIALLAVSAILFASSFRAAPQAASAPNSGFYPPLPAPDVVDTTTSPIVTLPSDYFNTPPATPTPAVMVENVSTTFLDPSQNWTHFQGSFTYDSAIV